MSGFKFTMKSATKRPTSSGFLEPQAKVPRALPGAAPPVARSAPAADDVDPLDAFMAGINAEIAKPSKPTAKTQEEKAAAPWEDFEEEDAVASYFEECETKGPKQNQQRMEGSDAEADDGDVDPEEDGDRRNKAIEPIPPIDHSKTEYNEVQRDFYKVHQEVLSMTDDAVTSLRKELLVSATGMNLPNPVASFAHLRESIGKGIMEGIRKHGYEQPTPIQAQAIPAALSGSDVIGIAKTGSGKTMSYLLPMLVHCMAQPVLEKGEGPIGVVLCPTRELAVQIEQETFRFKKHCGLRSVTLAGGLSKHEQVKEMKRGCEIAICNPGRLIDMIKMNCCTMQRVTMVVLDEADRMFDMGFEYQVRSIVQNVRPSRQTMLFSATFPPKIERLAREILSSPVRITIGEVGGAAENISQVVALLDDDDSKWPWLSDRINEMIGKGQVLIFVKSIVSAGDLQKNFKELLAKNVEVLHGDLDQNERMKVISQFKKEKSTVLVATDVASRGLDITTIRTVVCYDMANNIETHTHRVGRTGRAGAAGDAFTLLVDSDQNKKTAALLVENLQQAKQPVSEQLLTLAMKHKPYAAARQLGKTMADHEENQDKGKGREKGKGKGKVKGKSKAEREAALEAAFES